MIFRLALRNIIGNGWRSFINILIIAIVMIGMIFMESMYHSWTLLAKTQQKEWESGKGMFRVNSYDPFDAFSWDKSFEPLPDELRPVIERQEAVPILFSPGVIYPGGRMIPCMVKGIPADQTLLNIPSSRLVERTPGYTPAIIGQTMAKSSQLEEGDILTLRIKDVGNAFNTLDLEIVHIMNTPVPTVDGGIIWMDLNTLQELKQAPSMVTAIALQDPSLGVLSLPGFHYMDEKALFFDLDEMMKTETVQKYITYSLLMFLAMIAIFDTQALAVFKRRKEIGTLTALGMSQRQITTMFTLEGGLYSLFAIGMTAILGTPMFWYFATTGYIMPEGYDSFGILGFMEPIKMSYPPLMLLQVFSFVVLVSVVVSWIPARRIARMKATDALRGKVV